MKKERKVGIFIIAMLLVLFFGFNYLKGINFLYPANKYYAIYDNIDQLAISNPVLINGYTVGRVSNISILQQKNNSLLVELDINSDIVLGDSTVAILNADFLGNKSILLDIGNVSTPLSRGDTLYTDVAKGVLDMFTEQAEPVANNVQVTLVKLDAVLDKLAVSSNRLDSIFAKFINTPDLISMLIGNLNNKIDSVSFSAIHTMTTLTHTLEEIQGPIKNFNTFSHSLNKLKIAQTLTKTQKVLTRLNLLLSKTTNPNNTIGKLMTEDSLYVSINLLVRRLDTLALHLDNDPKRFLAPLGRTKQQIQKEKKRTKKKE